MSESAKQDKLQRMERIIKCVNTEWVAFQDTWAMQEKAYNYLRSQQYTAAQKAYYDRQKRPTNVFNHAFEKFNFVLGDHFLNDANQRVMHKSGGSPQIAKIWEDVLYHYHSLNNYRMEVGRTVFAGWCEAGALYVRWSDEYDIDGGIVYTNVPEFDVMYDSRAIDYWLRDAAYVIRHRWMTTTDLKAAWPHMAREIQEALDHIDDSDYADRSGAAYAVQRTAITDPKYLDRKDGKYRVVEFHDMNFESAEIVIDPDTGNANIFSIRDERRRSLFLKANPQLKIITRKKKVKKITTVIPALGVELERKDADIQDGEYDIIIYQPYPYGRRKIDNFGMMRIFADPQDFINDMMNRYLDTMNKSANTGEEIVREAYENPDDIINFGSMPGIKLIKKVSFIGRETYKRLDPPKPDAAALQMIEAAQSFINIVTGATNNMMGRSETSNEPSSLYAQRVAQGQIKFAVPNYVLNSFKTHLNNKMIRTGQANIPTNKLFLILDKDTFQTKEVFANVQAGDQVLNNLQVGEYEVVVEDGTKNPTMVMLRNEKKMKIVELLINVIGTPAAAAIDWDSLLKDQDVGDMTQWIELIKQVVSGQLQAQAQQGALDQANQILDAAKNQADAMNPETPAPAPGQGKPAKQKAVA